MDHEVVATAISLAAASSEGRLDMTKTTWLNNNEEVRRFLPWAIRIGDTSLIKLLLAEYARYPSEKAGLTPLAVAAHCGHAEAARLIMTKKFPDGRDTIDVGDDNKMTPFHHACVMGHVATARLLLRAGVDPDSFTKDGMTGLHLAALEGHGSVVRLLLDEGAATMLRDGWGYTPLYLASTNQRSEAYQVLVERVDDAYLVLAERVDDADETNKDSLNVLQLALMAGVSQEVFAKMYNKFWGSSLHPTSNAYSLNIVTFHVESRHCGVMLFIDTQAAWIERIAHDTPRHIESVHEKAVRIDGPPRGDKIAEFSVSVYVIHSGQYLDFSACHVGEFKSSVMVWNVMGEVTVHIRNGDCMKKPLRPLRLGLATYRGMKTDPKAEKVLR